MPVSLNYINQNADRGQPNQMEEVKSYSLLCAFLYVPEVQQSTQFSFFNEKK